MRTDIENLIRQALSRVAEREGWPSLLELPVQAERTRDPQHGDFTTNIAMRAAKALGQKPRDLAAQIVAELPATGLVESAVVAGPGFVNLTVSLAAFHAAAGAAIEAGDHYGQSAIGVGKRILLEFVSANPTGPLHVGHGRGAAYGASLANLLRACGYEVDCEYYVNDAGRQMDILALSVWLRYLQADDPTLPFPPNCYQAEYCREIAAAVAALHPRGFGADGTRFAALLNAPTENLEAWLDELIALAKAELGTEGFRIFFDAAIQDILGDIRDDLGEFGVRYQRWYSERSLEESGAIDRAIEDLRNRGLLYESEGATWFRTTDFGDDKDRVIVRENGAKTYFASDIAYHREKCERGYDLLLNVLGSDHHGYIGRLQAALSGFGKPVDMLEVQLVQFVVLFRGAEKVQMTTRGGTYVTLRDLRDEVGRDAARFFYVSRSVDQHLDFDLDLAKSQSNDNPVYYVQYAHARIASVLRRLLDEGGSVPADTMAALAALTLPVEKQLLSEVSRFADVIAAAANNRAPQTLVTYLRELAAAFHSYYNGHRIFDEDPAIRDARITLGRSIQLVIRNGLRHLGVSAPESM